MGKQPFHIVAYALSADIHCPDCIRNWARNQLRHQGYTEREIKNIEDHWISDIDVGFGAIMSESILSFLANLLNINLQDEYSYDSDDFPKIIFSDQIEQTENCGTCHIEIS